MPRQRCASRLAGPGETVGGGREIPMPTAIRSPLEAAGFFSAALSRRLASGSEPGPYCAEHVTAP